MAEIKTKQIKPVVEINWAMTLSNIKVGDIYEYNDLNGYKESYRAMRACNYLKSAGNGVYSVNRNKDYQTTGKFKITRLL